MTHEEFIAAIGQTIGRPPLPGTPRWSLEFPHGGKLEIQPCPDTVRPGIWVNAFSFPQEAFPEGASYLTGDWNIVPSPRDSDGPEENRQWAVKELQKRLARVGWTPPVVVLPWLAKLAEETRKQYPGIVRVEFCKRKHLPYCRFLDAKGETPIFRLSDGMIEVRNAAWEWIADNGGLPQAFDFPPPPLAGNPADRLAESLVNDPPGEGRAGLVKNLGSCGPRTYTPHPDIEPPDPQLVAQLVTAFHDGYEVSFRIKDNQIHVLRHYPEIQAHGAPDLEASYAFEHAGRLSFECGDVESTIVLAVTAHPRAEWVCGGRDAAQRAAGLARTRGEPVAADTSTAGGWMLVARAFLEGDLLPRLDGGDYDENPDLDVYEELTTFLGQPTPGIAGLPMEEGDEDHPLWCIDAQIRGLLEGGGASEDLEAVKGFFRAAGLPESTAARVRDALCAAEVKPVSSKPLSSAIRKLWRESGNNNY